ncbi:MAG TPA: peptide chain release factor N(5)-glutamine methyltransferase [Vicinamibacteria bacterium]|nr:peptide chain release factor N(5)-glutamine methyltransferase [Vicinamibacteria bacterium]
MIASEAIEQAAGRLASSGVPEPRLDAERLLRHVTGWDAAALLVHSRDALAEDDEQRFQELVAQRARRRPMQHLLGVAPFWRHELRVTPDVLIPRPETEHLVEAALEVLRPIERPVVVDVGTGSGCIALAIAAERPDATVHAIDVSPEALAVARENAARLGLADRVRFHLGDLLEPVRGERIDLVVSNPPYVGADEVEALAPEVRDHDPRAALVPPGGDRFSVYRRLAADAPKSLAAGGVTLLEIGQGMEAEVTARLRAAGLTVDRVLPDLQGIPRVVQASWRGR